MCSHSGNRLVSTAVWGQMSVN